MSKHLKVRFLVDTGHHFRTSKGTKWRKPQIRCIHCDGHTSQAWAFLMERITKVSPCNMGQAMLFDQNLNAAPAWRIDS